MLVGSASIAQQTIDQYLRRRPGDLDFYVDNPTVWKYLKQHGKEVPGAIGNSVIQFTIDGIEVEFFQFLPGYPDHRIGGVFRRGEWSNGVLCMSLWDIALWKYHLQKMESRAERKRRNDRSDAIRATYREIKNIVFGAMVNENHGVVASMISTGMIHA